ncbi:TIGR01841 family phasin [Brevundimonas sp. AJA228-03]|uniref:phasin family protein n=1 Tax=Brevundimonas sp. AJA228-03 TaxID=2752515 RepID=UPI001ADFC2AA|nr:TIGR01841 family phasin [Brevundimonas sp. AJA228-03]QTN19011.1 TIGR01841 family phasin [Brevundimonas sp. AJA228-03]
MADSAETIKKTVETATTTAKAQAEKIQATGTQALRETLDKTSASIAELSAHSKQNLEALTASATAAQKGVEALSSQALSYSKSSWENGVAAAQTIAKARSVQELIELQTNYAKSAMETYLSEVTKMTETLTGSVKESFKPINERVTATVETFQAAR